MKDPCAECQLREQRNKCFQNRELPDTSAEEDGSGVRGDAARGFRSADTPVLKAVIESSSDCILVLDRECRTLYANPAAIRHAMTTKDNLIGKSIREALAHVPDLMQTAMNRVDAVFQSGEKMHFTDKVHIGNRIVFNESTLSPVHDEKGRMFAVSVIYRDITEQKNLAQKLARSEQEYKELYNQAQVALFRSRLSDGKLHECNHAMALLFGYKDKEECLAHYSPAAHHADPARCDELLKRLKKGKTVTGFHFEIIRCNGKRAWVAVTCKLDAERGYIEGFEVDITAAKVLTKTEKQILELIMQGKCNKETARILCRSIRTIEDHRSRIMRKLSAENMVELVQIAQSLNCPYEMRPKKPRKQDL